MQQYSVFQLSLLLILSLLLLLSLKLGVYTVYHYYCSHMDVYHETTDNRIISYVFIRKYIKNKFHRLIIIIMLSVIRHQCFLWQSGCFLYADKCMKNSKTNGYFFLKAYFFLALNRHLSMTNEFFKFIVF